MKEQNFLSGYLHLLLCFIMRWSDVYILSIFNCVDVLHGLFSESIDNFKNESKNEFAVVYILNS